MRTTLVAVVLYPRLCPDETWFGMAACTISYFLVVFGGCNIAFSVCKWPIKVSKDSTEGHCIKAMRSFSIVEVLQPRLWPDDAWFGMAACTISYFLVVCGGCNILFRVWKWPINVGAGSAEGHRIKAITSFSMVEVLQPRFCPDDAWFGVAACTISYLLIVWKLQHGV